MNRKLLFAFAIWTLTACAQGKQEDLCHITTGQPQSVEEAVVAGYRFRSCGIAEDNAVSAVIR